MNKFIREHPSISFSVMWFLSFLLGSVLATLTLHILHLPSLPIPGLPSLPTDTPSSALCLAGFVLSGLFAGLSTVKWFSIHHGSMRRRTAALTVAGWIAALAVAAAFFISLVRAAVEFNSFRPD